MCTKGLAAIHAADLGSSERTKKTKQERERERVRNDAKLAREL